MWGVVSQWIRYIRMDGREQDINFAGILTGSLAAIKESTSVAYTGTNGISYAEGKIVKLLPEGIEDYIEQLDAARYIFLRKYEGLEGYYVAATNMTAPASSDYANIEDVRVMYRLAARCTRELSCIRTRTLTRQMRKLTMHRSRKT